MLDVADQLTLARAVADGGRARLLRGDNTAGPAVSLVDAVDSGRAYFVTPRPVLLVIDLDLPGDPAEAGTRRRSFRQLLARAAASGVPCVVAASGTRENRHAFLAVGTGPGRSVIRDWCLRHGLDVRDRGVRPPGSPHRDLVHRSQLLDPLDVREVARMLARPADPASAEALVQALSETTLPGRIRTALRDGHAAAGYATPSHARMGLAVAIRARGGPATLLHTLLDDTGSPLGATYRAKPARWQRQELTRLWDKAGQWLTRPPNTAIGTTVAAWDQAVHAGRWVGLAGGSDLACAEALLAVAEKAHTDRPAVALADVACGAGVSLDTARRAVRRLVAAGWLAVDTPETARSARVYRLTIASVSSEVEQAAGNDGSLATGPAPAPRPRTGGKTPALTDPGAVDGDADLGADAARWRALGKLTVRVDRVVRLAGGEVTAVEVARSLNWRVPAARYHLRKLERAGLVERAGPRWRTATDRPGLTAVSAELGTAGARDRQKAAVWQAREDRRRHQAACRRRTSPPTLAPETPPGGARAPSP